MNIHRSHEIAQAVRNWLTKDEWLFKTDEEQGIFTFGISLSKNIRRAEVVVDVRQNDYLVYGMFPLKADEDNPQQMARMAEFMCRANFGLIAGNFELDFTDGEIRFKYYVDCQSAVPSLDQVKDSILCTIAMLDRYSEGILAILFSDMDPEQAVEQCETME